jgi:hypothetical protein
MRRSATAEFDPSQSLGGLGGNRGTGHSVWLGADGSAPMLVIPSLSAGASKQKFIRQERSFSFDQGNSQKVDGAPGASTRSMSKMDELSAFYGADPRDRANIAASPY